MPEMQHAGREISVLAAHVRMQEPYQQIGILTAPSVIIRIETIDAVEIISPDREIARTRMLPFAGTQFAQRPERQRQHRCKPVDIVAAAPADPGRKIPVFRLEMLRQDAPREILRHQDAVAGDEPTALSQRTMTCNEAGTRDAIAIEEDTIVAPAFEDRAIADFAGTEPAMFMPDVFEAAAKFRFPKFLFPLRDQRSGSRTRSIIGDNHLEIAIRLPRKRTQNNLERVLAIVRRDDDGDEISHAAVPSARLSCNGSKFPRRSRPRAKSPHVHPEIPPSEDRSG
jgi:hypothetical protein